MGAKIAILITAVITFFSPVSFIALAIGGAIAADTITAIALRKHKFTSKRLIRGVLRKTIMYQASILTFYLVDYAMINDAMLTVFSVEYTSTKAVGLFFVGFEIISIDEKIRNKYGDDKGIIARFKKFIKSIRSFKDSV